MTLMDDERLMENKEVLEWFQNWKDNTNGNVENSNKEKSDRMMLVVFKSIIRIILLFSIICLLKISSDIPPTCRQAHQL